MTSGVSCRPIVMSPPCAIQATESLPTLSLLIWSSGLYRHALAVRLYCGQLFGSSVPGSAARAILAVPSKQANAKPVANDALLIVSSLTCHMLGRPPYFSLRPRHARSKVNSTAYRSDADMPLGNRPNRTAFGSTDGGSDRITSGSGRIASAQNATNIVLGVPELAPQDPSPRKRLTPES